MTPLRQRMLDAMVLRGMAQRTQEAYTEAIARLARHYHRSPDALSAQEVQAYLLREDEPGFAPLDDRLLGLFLDGLVVHLRGARSDAPPRPPEKRINNNAVLKKLRVAFELKDVDLVDIFASAGRPVTKPELSALFRQPGHKNFRLCGDQLLRYFLRGLTLRVRGE